jgi:RNA polymerase sigma-70 factor (ECF subfamily)
MLRDFFSFDGEYLRRLRTGDPQVEYHFTDYFSALLRAKLQVRLRNSQEVEDLKQEVFLRVLQYLRSGPGLNDPAKLGAFVHSVCNNVLLEHFRSRGRVDQWDESAPEPRGTGVDPDEQLMSAELRVQVSTVLNGLPAKDRGLLRAVFLEEQDKDTVCRDYGVGRDYLRVLLHRARRRLREVLVQSKLNAAVSGGASQ